jgi:LPXTG-motif cell wall-anchored protein
VKQNIVVENERVRSIRIKKIDKNNEARVLSGAEFEIYDHLDALVATVTTDGTGYAVKEIVPGTYTVKETKAPSNYYLDSEPQTVIVDVSAISFELVFKNTRVPSPPTPPAPTPAPEEEPEEDEEPEEIKHPEKEEEKKEETTTKDEPKGGKVEVPEDGEITIEDEPENGDLEVDPDGNWTYTPKDDFVGKDTFVIKITDDEGNEEIIYFEFEVEETPLGFTELPQTGESRSILPYLGSFLMLFGLIFYIKSRK